MDPATNGAGGMLNLEKELVCFICTEILYQPLTLIDCLHTFCGSCLKTWFQLQHHKACTSHSSSSAVSTNPYTCPTCRASVKTARPNAMVNTWLDLYLTANPSRAPTQEDKDEKSANYKPDDDILPKVVRGRRRERRHRRDHEENLERQMVEQAREQSLREVQDRPPPHRDLLQPDNTSVPMQRSRSRERNRERDERRARRREEERQRRQLVAEREAERVAEREAEHEAAAALDEGQDEDLEEPAPTLPPVSSPRHPDAVEERQRQQRVMHQASLVSLISSSEGTTGSSMTDSLNENDVRDLIMAEGLYDGIDLDSLTEAEQDALAERIAAAFRRRQRAQRAAGDNRSLEPLTLSPTPTVTTNLQPDSHSQQQSRERSASNQRRTEMHPPSNSSATISASRPRSSRITPSDLATTTSPPLATTVVAQRRRRPSNQSQSNANVRIRSGQSSPRATPIQSGNNSTTDLGTGTSTSDVHASDRASRPEIVTRSSTDPQKSSTTAERSVNDPAEPAQGLTQSSLVSMNTEKRVNTFPIGSPRSSTAQLPNGTSMSPRSPTRPLHQPSSRTMTFYKEPLVTCFRCARIDIQYKLHKYCESCDVSVCLDCYRTRHGCNFWYDFGSAAMERFNRRAADRIDSEPLQPPHQLIGRRLCEPYAGNIVKTEIANDGKTMIVSSTLTDPATRVEQGYFCDRCGRFANDMFYTCRSCNSGEWGFCEPCVNTHHCCTHALWPVKGVLRYPPGRRYNTNTSNFAPTVSPTSEAHGGGAAPNRSLSEKSASSNSSVLNTTEQRTGLRYVKINTECNECHKSIALTTSHYHCPFHVSDKGVKGDYDICHSCYKGCVEKNQVKPEDGPEGWRMCHMGHRMIVTTLILNPEGGCLRMINNDLVGGRYFSDAYIQIWKDLLAKQRSAGNEPAIDVAEFESIVSKGKWHWQMDLFSEHRATHHHGDPRALSVPKSTMSPTNSNPDLAATPLRYEYPPDGGFGAYALAKYPCQPVGSNVGKYLTLPYSAMVTELKWIDENNAYGVYAGDWGYVPLNRLRSANTHGLL